MILTFRKRALAFGAAIALSLSVVAVAGAASSDECAPPTDPSSISQQTKWQECRLDRIDVALDGLAKPAVTETVTKTVTATPPPATTTSATTTPPATTTTTASPTTTATPTPTTTTTTPPPAGGGTVILGRSFPNAATTGVPAGTTLTPYTGSCTLSDPSAAPLTINAKTITCDQFRILQPGVKITNSVINGTVYSDCCYLAGSFEITDSEVRGPNSTATVVGEARFKLLRVEVTGGSRSVNCNSECDIRDSYIHGQYGDTRGIDHESGIRQDSKGTFIHNTIACDAVAYPRPGGGEGSGCSAAISGYGDFGTVNNNTFTNNLISSGQSDDGSPASSYCIYGGSTPGKPYPNAHHIVFKDNILMRGPGGKCGIYGPVTSFDSAATGNVWTNNVYDNGVAIPPTM